MKENTTATDEPSTPSENPEAPLRSYRATEDILRRIQNNFEYHAPKGDQAQRYNYLRAQLRALAYEIVERTPPGREQSVALTKLEEVGFWMNAAIARNE